MAIIRYFIAEAEVARGDGGRGDVQLLGMMPLPYYTLGTSLLQDFEAWVLLRLYESRFIGVKVSTRPKKLRGTSISYRIESFLLWAEGCLISLELLEYRMHQRLLLFLNGIKSDIVLVYPRARKVLVVSTDLSGNWTVKRGLRRVNTVFSVRRFIRLQILQLPFQVDGCQWLLLPINWLIGQLSHEESWGRGQDVLRDPKVEHSLWFTRECHYIIIKIKSIKSCLVYAQGAH